MTDFQRYQALELECSRGYFPAMVPQAMISESPRCAFRCH